MENFVLCETFLSGCFSFEAYEFFDASLESPMAKNISAQLLEDIRKPCLNLIEVRNFFAEFIIHRLICGI